MSRNSQEEKTKKGKNLFHDILFFRQTYSNKKLRISELHETAVLLLEMLFFFHERKM
jgi:hypothetical protein